MKRSKRSGGFMKQVPLLVALLAAFVFSASSGLRPILPESYQQEVSSDKGLSAGDAQEGDERDDRPVARLDYACSALAPVASFIFQQYPFVKAPLPDLVFVAQKLPALPPLRTDSYFLTLFRIIISPNAP